MILTIWRHGDAEKGAIDRQRQLTESGCDDIGFGCRQFHEACSARGIPHPGLILYSPWVRALQTAEIIAGAFTHATSRAEAALQPGGDASSVNTALGNVIDPRVQHILLVSHQPLISYLAEFYLDGNGHVPPLSPGGLLTLEFEVLAQQCGALRFWALPPEYEVGI
jgi:phosphohistidine phosphatase SixA